MVAHVTRGEPHKQDLCQACSMGICKEEDDYKCVCLRERQRLTGCVLIGQDVP